VKNEKTKNQTKARPAGRRRGALVVSTESDTQLPDESLNQRHPLWNAH
jgi:hypothetical protein